MKEILITSSVLILVIVLFRQLFRNKVSRRLQYGLWLLVALRLLIPIQFGQSDYSVTSITEKIESESKPIQQIQQVLQEPVAGPSRAELYEQLLNEYLQKNEAPAEPEVQEPVVPETREPVTPEIREQIENQVEEQITAPTLSEILTAIWIAGIALMAVWLLIANLSFLRQAKQSSEAWTGTAPVQVRISPNVPTPCLVGLFRPVIYLTPASTRDENALHHILTHELTHLRHGDHLWSVLRCVCLCVYWFDPLVWLAAILSKRDCELACDEAALQKLGDSQRIAYGKTLLATVTQSRSPAHILETATAMNETKKQLKERVNRIVKKPKTLLIAAIALLLIAALAAGLAFAGSKPGEPSATEPQSTEPASTEPTLPEPECPTDPPYQMSEVKARFIANDLIGRYEQYRTDGVCCDNTFVYEDLSRFLTDTQKTNYDNSQLLLTCCHSAEDVREHIDKTLSPSLIDGYPDDWLFTDDEGNLYVLDAYDGHYGLSQSMTISQYTNDQIIAIVELRNPDDSYYSSQMVTLAQNSSRFMVTNFEWFNMDVDTLPYSTDDYAQQRWETMDLAMEQLGLSYIEFLYASNSTVAAATAEYAPDIAASVPWDTEAMAYRSLYMRNGTLTLSFPIRGFGNIGDPLSGFFAWEIIAPEDDIAQEAYRWFFGELRQSTDNISVYTELFLDAFYRQPDLCLRNMAELDDDAVSSLTAQIYATLIDWDEYEQFTQHLDSLSAGTDWTDREARVLDLLAIPPESFTTPDDTLSIATKLIKKYNRYEVLHLFCDLEYVHGDMSGYLTDKQKEEYWDSQQRITCCHTPEEVREHIRRSLHYSLIGPNYPDDELFYDDEGNLYLIVLPTDYSGYYNIRIAQRSDTQILAYGDCGYDSYEYSSAFVIELENGEWMIKEVYHFADPYQTSNTEALAETADLAEERLGISYVEFLYISNQSVLQALEHSNLDPSDKEAARDLISWDVTAIAGRRLYLDEEGTLRFLFQFVGNAEESHPLYGTNVLKFDLESWQQPDHLEGSAYAWFLSELYDRVESDCAETYGRLLLDAFFLDPDTFLNQLSGLEAKQIRGISSLLSSSLTQYERPVYEKLLDAITARTDLTDAEQQTLEILYGEAVLNRSV